MSMETRNSVVQKVKCKWAPQQEVQGVQGRAQVRHTKVRN